jgi:hypothetical protein
MIGILWATLAQAAPIEASLSVRVLDAGGAPVTSSTSLGVSLFASDTAPTSFWSDSFVVTPEGGYAALKLGRAGNVLDSGQVAGAWYQLSVGGSPIGPRTRLGEAPAAAVAFDAPTPPAGDNDTSIATTAWVRQNGGMTWSVVTGATTATANRGYVVDAATRATITLPSGCAVGDRIAVAGRGAGGWTVAPAAGDTLRHQGVDVGSSSGLLSTASWETLDVVCAVADSGWQVVGYTGTPFGCTAGNIIPVMTSNTAPSGVASASTTYSVTYEPYFAFTTAGAGDPTSSWLTSPNTTTGWLRYQFPAPATVVRYEIVAGNNYTTANAATWSFQGSNDGTNWTTLDSRSGVTWTVNQVRTYTLSAPATYLYYRVNVTANGGYAGWLQITDLRMYCQ